ncbi:MAG: acyltransferase [Zunongwangia sp.]|uniref:acyltransferase n=1 Tax=Zunongwangia sp. TaxID=1965325 RepID=UPI0032422492
MTKRFLLKPAKMKRLKLQVFFILLYCFNCVHSMVLPMFLKRILYMIVNYHVGANTSIQNIKFFHFGKLRIGKNSIVNSGVYLDNRRGITIGDHVVIAHNSKIYTLGHDINDDVFVTKGKPVVLEDYVIVFANALIMPGVILKKGAVVLPGAVVSKDVEEMSVVGGNPAKEVKKRQYLHVNKQTKHYWFSL